MQVQLEEKIIQLVLVKKFNTSSGLIFQQQAYFFIIGRVIQVQNSVQQKIWQYTLITNLSIH
jgi:hypothetical protein